VTAFEEFGNTRVINGGDGDVYKVLEIPGSYLSNTGDWYDGTFQFIKDTSGNSNHRLFVPDAP
jgi:hypothetical protein